MRNKNVKSLEKSEKNIVATKNKYKNKKIFSKKFNILLIFRIPHLVLLYELVESTLVKNALHRFEQRALAKRKKEAMRWERLKKNFFFTYE